MGKSTGSEQEKQLQQIFEHLRRLDQRLARVEKKVGLSESATEPVYLAGGEAAEITDSPRPELEFQIGEFWFARIGIIVLAVGFAFLLTLKYENLPLFVPPMIGYILVAGLLGLSRFFRKSSPNLPRYMTGAGLVLLYFSTLRLHYFGEMPLITNMAAETVLLLAAVVIQLWVAYRHESRYLTVQALALLYLTALLNGSTIFVFLMLVLASTIFAYFAIRYEMPLLILPGMLMTYISHTVWFLNNPVIGNPVRLVDGPFYNIYFALLCMAIFAIGQLFLIRRRGEDNAIISTTMLNCIFGYAVFFMLTFVQFDQGFALSHLIASAMLLGISILYWSRVQGRYTTFLYAMLGYSALSVAIIAEFPHPDRFILLSWQSVVVIVTALWFRSRIIVVANLFIFLAIFLAYLLFAGEVQAVSLSFGIISLLSARIMHWQSERLEIKTDTLRNTYLFAAFLSFPYALYHSVPGQYIILSWIGLSIFYYLISLLLNNKKYRYLALGTIGLTVGYIFVVGIAKLPPVFRVLSFILLGIFLLIISLIYTRIRNRSQSGNAEVEGDAGRPSTGAGGAPPAQP